MSWLCTGVQEVFKKEIIMSEMLGPYRVVDLSKKLYPEREKRRLALRRYLVAEAGDYHTEMDLMSHLGTHVESPYHHRDDWPDVLQLPVTNFVGRGVLLNLADIAPRAPILGADLDKADRGRVRPGDIVILTSPHHCEPFTNDPNDQRPNLGPDAADWFAAKEVKGVGFGDSIAIENNPKDSLVFHNVLMAKNVIFVEVMQHLNQLQDDIFMIILLPLPIAGLDSCPVRAIVLEGVPGFSPIS
jgi:kynurenine formamidase